jgi:hypothetical protein
LRVRTCENILRYWVLRGKLIRRCRQTVATYLA